MSPASRAARAGTRGRRPLLCRVAVQHHRRSPIEHRFRYKAVYWVVEYDTLDAPRGWAARLISVRGEDHLDVKAELAARNIEAERIMLMTMPRVLGYAFNPLSVYWCWDRSSRLTALVAEVHNTYGGRHLYVLDPADEATTEKAMPVSPFHPSEGCYIISAPVPDDTVAVSVRYERDGTRAFTASLAGSCRPVSTTRLICATLRYSPAWISVLIRWEALRLWRKGLRAAAP
jgi:uncharacterized protein